MQAVVLFCYGGPAISGSNDRLLHKLVYGAMCGN